MRKLLAILVLIVVLAGGYSFYWHKKADDFRQMFVQSIDSINATAKPYTKDLQLVRYDSVAVTGFPFDMKIEISKPTIDIPVSELIKAMPRKAASQTPPSPSEWVEELSIDDRIVLSGNIAGDRFTRTVIGNVTQKSIVNHNVRRTMLWTMSGPSVCHLGVEQVKGGAPWTMQPIFTDLPTFLAIFRSIDCSAQGIALKDAGSGAQLATGDEIAFAVSNENGNGGNQKIALMFDTKKVKATPQGDAVYKDYMQMVYAAQGQDQQMVGVPIALSEQGEETIKVDVRYDGPTASKSFQDPGMSLHFDVNNLDSKNDLSDMSLQAHVATAPEGNDRLLSIAVHAKAEVTPHFDELMQKAIAAMIGNIEKMPPQSDPKTQVIQKLSALGKPEDVVARLWPSFHSLGKTAFDFDFNIKGPNQGPKFIKQALVKLDDLDWTATPYGIKTKGSSNMSEAGKMPTGDLTITCLSCDALVSDAGDYAMRVESVVDQLSTPPKPPVLNKELIESIKQFLHGIAENALAKDLVLHFAMDNKGGFTISGKQVPEVLALYMNTIAPRLPQPSPAAGEPATAPKKKPHQEK